MSQSFDFEPAFLAPNRVAFRLKVDRTADAVTVWPGGIPVAFVVACLLFVDSIVAWAWWHGLIELPLPALCIAIGANLGSLGVVYGMNRWIVPRGPFFVLKLSGHSITLPCSGITLARGEIEELVEVHGCWTWREAGGRPSTTFISQLHAITRKTGSARERCLLASATASRPITDLSSWLVPELGVKHRIVRGVESYQLPGEE